MPKQLKFVVERWVLFMVRRQMWQAQRFEIFESAHNFQIKSGREIRIRIKSRSFANPYYRRTTSVSELISQLEWQSLEERRKNARLSLFYKGLHGLAAVPVHEFQHPTRCTRYSGTDTFTVMSSHTDAYKFSFLPRTVTDWNARLHQSQAVYWFLQESPP